MAPPGRFPNKRHSLLTIRPNNGADAAQVVSRHAWEQVMLDPIIEAAIDQIDKPVSPNVARRKHLLS